MRNWLVLAITLAGCAGDEPPPAGTCTGKLYEPCAQEHDCASNLCQNFNEQGFQVCTQPCDATNVCPDGAECNAQGLCQPAAAVDCELPL